MAQLNPSRGSAAWTFVLLGSPLIMALGTIELIVQGVTRADDMTSVVLATMVASNPIILLYAWAIWLLPLALTGVVALKLDARLTGSRFVAACAAVGATFTVVSGLLLNGSHPNLPDVAMMAIYGGVASLACALLTQAWRRRTPRDPDLLPHP